MKSKYILPLLAGASVFLNSCYKEVRGEPRPVQPQMEVPTEVQSKSGLDHRLEQAILGSGECERVYWSKIRTREGDERLLICEGKKQETKFRINVDNIAEVRVQANHGGYIFEWMVGDDVVVRTPDEHVYAMRFWDKPAKEINDILRQYIRPDKKLGELVEGALYERKVQDKLPVVKSVSSGQDNPAKQIDIPEVDKK